MGIAEPAGAAVPLLPLRAMLVPALAVGVDGARLGKGGGSYDSVIAGLPAEQRPRVVALVRDDDVMPASTVPIDAHDQRVDAIITPTRAIDSDRQCRNQHRAQWEKGYGRARGLSDAHARDDRDAPRGDPLEIVVDHAGEQHLVAARGQRVQERTGARLGAVGRVAGHALGAGKVIDERQAGGREGLGVGRRPLPTSSAHEGAQHLLGLG
ncbi:MAG: 5-formyltetrahydrofolate cyclo-ligase [Actinomycetota bacterium]